MRTCILTMIVAALALPTSARAEFLGADQGKLLMTGGFSTLEGAAGGALTPWSFIAGYGSNRSWGANAFATDVSLSDLRLRSLGAAVGAFDRFEISYGRQDVEVESGALKGLRMNVDIVGAKVRLIGDTVYGQDSWLPQVAVGAQFKRHNGIEDFALTSVEQLGAADTEGVDYYLSATKLSLASNVLISVTARATKSNQLGLLGFGGDKNDDYKFRAEATAAYLLTRKLAVGGEYRARPRNLSVDDEEAAWDAFIAWAPSKYFSIIAAYANIGALLTPVTGQTDDQEGAYVSIQGAF